MIEFFQKLFSTDFAPHAFCLRLPWLIQLHVWSDLVIAGSYFLIPLSLVGLVRRRKDLVFPWMFVLFGLFIFSCGLTHVLGAWTLWHPIYRFDGLVKAFTAAVSLPTAILLIGIVPRALELPSAERLRAEVLERQRAEERVHELNAELQTRIEERTRELNKTAELLARSEQLTLMAVKASRLGTWFWNLDTGEHFWDENTRRILGLSEDDRPATLELLFGLLHPSDCSHVRSEFDQALRKGSLENLECRILRSDGSERWVRVRGNLDGVERTKTEVFLATVMDITQQKGMELDLARLASIVESSDDAIIGLDIAGVITTWNRGAERVFGYHAPEIIGHSVSLLFAPQEPGGMDELLPRIRNGERLEHFETVYRRKSGDLIHISLSVSPIANDAGLIVGVSEIARDITRRKELDTALRTSEERFRTLAETVPETLFIADSEGTIRFLSARFFSDLGIPEHGADPNQTYLSSLHPEDADSVAALWNRSVRDRTPFQAEFRMRRKGGGYRWVVTRSLPVAAGDNGHLQWIGASTDIDQLKRVEKALVQSNGELRQFAYAAAHDLQEPLRNVVNAAGMLNLRANEGLDEPSRQYLHFCIEGAERMHGMIKDLLAFATVVEGAPASNLATDSSQVIEDVEANLALALKESNATLLIADLPEVAVERTHLLQLFQNIVGNALKYRSPQRLCVIRVSAVRLAEEWRFEIADNGIGFKPDYKERIFGVFKRLHRSSEYSGSGIGLALCARIVAHYGGRIWAEPELDRGASFFFTLPAAVASVTTRLPEAAHAEAAT